MMTSEIIIFNPSSFNVWKATAVINFPGKLTLLADGEFFGSKQIAIHDKNERGNCKMTHYLFSKN